MFKDLYTGSPWSLPCSSCRVLQSVFCTRSKVYWGKMGSVLWPAVCAKGIERDVLWTSPGCASCLSFGHYVWCPSCSDPHHHLISSQMIQVLQGHRTLSPSTPRAAQPGAGLWVYSGSQVSLASKFCSWRVSLKPYLFITLFPFQSKSAAIYKCLTGTYLPYACLRSSRKEKGN